MLHVFIEYKWHVVACIVAWAIAKQLMMIPSTRIATLQLNPLRIRFLANGLHCASLFAGSVVLAEMCGVRTAGLGPQLLTSGSVIVGFSTQDILKNFAAGVIIIFTRPFEVGDKITGNGITGVVVSVGFFNTRLKDNSNTGICVPNSKLNTVTLLNHSSSYRVTNTGMHRQPIKLYISAYWQLDQAVAVLNQVGKDMDAWILQKDREVEHKHGHLLHENHRRRYGIELEEDQKKHPSKVDIIGQDVVAGIEVHLLCFSNVDLTRAVFKEGFQRAVAALTAAGVLLHDPRQRVLFNLGSGGDASDDTLIPPGFERVMTPSHRKSA